MPREAHIYEVGRGAGAEVFWRTLGQLRGEKRLILGVFAALAAVVLLVAVNMPRTFTAETVLLFDSRRNPLFETGFPLVAMQMDAVAINSEIAAMQVSGILARVIDKLHLTTKPEYSNHQTAIAAPTVLESVLGSWVGGPSRTTNVDSQAHSEDRLRQAEALERMQAALKVINDPRTYTVRVRFTSANPVYAASVANAIADTYVDVQRETRMQGVREARIVSRALVPVRPSGIGRTGYGAIGALAALSLAVGTGLLRAKMRPVFRCSEDVESALLRPVIGQIPKVSWRQVKGHQLLHPSGSALAGLARGLAATLLASPYPPRKLLITSPSRGEGKTVTALALAAALARAGRTSLVIDANPGGESWHNLLGGETAGWSDILAGFMTLETVAAECTLPGLKLLSWGRQETDALGLLARDRLQAFFETTLAEFDFVIVDGSGVLTSNTQLIAPLADEALLVLRWNKTPRAVAARAATLLERTGRSPRLVLAQIDCSSMSRHEQGYLENVTVQ